MQNHRWAEYLFVVLAALGFLDATYLTVKFLTGGPIPCALTEGCERVTTSAYAEIAGIPVALLGAIYYLALFLLSLIYLSSGNHFLFKLFTRATIIGLLTSGWLVYVQIFILNSFCSYCLFSAVLSTVLFLLALFMAFRGSVGQRSGDGAALS